MKPEPSADLWQQLNDELEILKSMPVDRPADSFTSTEFAAKFNVSVSGAHRRLRKLAIAGKLVKHGHGILTYYTMK